MILPKLKKKNHRWISRWSKCKLIKYTYRRSVSVQLKTFLSYNIFVLHVHETQTHLILVMVMDWTCSAAGPNDSHNCKVILTQRQLSRRTANARKINSILRLSLMLSVKMCLHTINSQISRNKETRTIGLTRQHSKTTSSENILG